MVDLTGIDTLVPAFPVRPNVVMGSAARRTDGRIIYCYADGGDPDEGEPPIIEGQIRERTFNTAMDMAQGVRQRTYHSWRTGVPVPGSDMPIIENSILGMCSVWREGDQLILHCSYSDPLSEAQYKRSEFWVSPSGNGGDWYHASNLQTPTLIEEYRSELGDGRHTGMGYHGCFPTMAWIESGSGRVLNWKRPSVYSGGGTEWSLDISRPGLYGDGLVRRVVEHAGELWFNWTGHSGQEDSGYRGGPGAWTRFADPPSGRLWPYITSHLGHMLRLGRDNWTDFIYPQVQASPDPSVPGSWRNVTAPLHQGRISPPQLAGQRIGRSGGYVWCDGIGPLGVLVSHDKAWLPAGGWLLGALGRS